MAIVNESASRDPVPQDKAQHLNRIVARNGDECSDGINDRQLSANPGLESIIDLPSQPATEINLSAYSDSYRLTDDRRSNWEIKAASQDWLNFNYGEGVKDIFRFVIWRF